MCERLICRTRELRVAQRTDGVGGTWQFVSVASFCCCYCKGNGAYRYHGPFLGGGKLGGSSEKVCYLLAPAVRGHRLPTPCVTSLFMSVACPSALSLHNWDSHRIPPNFCIKQTEASLLGEYAAINPWLSSSGCCIVKPSAHRSGGGGGGGIIL